MKDRKDSFGDYHVIHSDYEMEPFGEILGEPTLYISSD